MPEKRSGCPQIGVIGTIQVLATDLRSQVHKQRSFLPACSSPDERRRMESQNIICTFRVSRSIELFFKY